MARLDRLRLDVSRARAASGTDSLKVAAAMGGVAIRGRLRLAPAACELDLAASELDLAARFRSAPRGLRAVVAQVRSPFAKEI